jgi:hypothetical protein
MVARELGKSKLCLVGVQEVRWRRATLNGQRITHFSLEKGMTSSWLTAVNTEAYHCCQLHTQFFYNILLCRIIPCADELIGKHQHRF